MKGKGKLPVEGRVKDLPPEIIEQYASLLQFIHPFNIQSSPSRRILYLTDPSTFTSLILVSSAWRNAAQTPHLYAYHLSRCPSFAINNNVITGPFTDESLKTLKRQLLQEVKRNLFEAYLRPQRTTINFISTTTSSSASFPGGEAFDFTFSPMATGLWPSHRHASMSSTQSRQGYQCSGS